ncbi:MAG: CPBP family intramembrane metalloprotease [Bacilli bacterium]|nr:CPBP family intramembrane metalloprotease [Bacilli bacterium]
MINIKKYINIKNFIILILLFILFYYSSLFKIFPMMIFNLSNKNPTDKIILTAFSDCCLLLILLFVFRKDIIKEFNIFKKDILKNFDIGFSCWIIGLLFMVISNVIISFILKAGGAENEKLIQQMISKSPWFMIITAGVIAPIIEELIFRKGFKNSFNNKHLFIILSGLVFGLMHVISSNSLLEFLYIIPYSSLGISFAVAYYKTDTVFTPIIFHMIHNLILIILAVFLH